MPGAGKLSGLLRRFNPKSEERDKLHISQTIKFKATGIIKRKKASGTHVTGEDRPPSFIILGIAGSEFGILV